MRTIKQSNPIAAERAVLFTAVDENSLQDRLTGLSGFTVHVRKTDGTDAAGAGSDPSEQDSIDMPGVYAYGLTVAEISAPGIGLVHVSNVSGMEPREIPFQVVPAIFGTAVTGSLTSSAFTTSLVTSTANHWQRAFLRWLTGSLAGQVGKISAYTVSGGVITMAIGHAFTSAPSNGDIFEIVNG